MVLPSQLRTGTIFVKCNGQLLVLLIGDHFVGEILFVFSLHQNRKIIPRQLKLLETLRLTGC